LGGVPAKLEAYQRFPRLISDFLPANFDPYQRFSVLTSENKLLSARLGWAGWLAFFKK
jgi:hypothetical protein